MSGGARANVQVAPGGSPVVMRLALLLTAALLAGCAAQDAAPAPERWSFTQRNTLEDARPLGEWEGFTAARELAADANVRQIGGQWHGALVADAPHVLRFDAGAAMTVEFRVSHEGASASGRCDWEENATEEKSLGLARVRMRSTSTTCEIVLTPTATLAESGGPTLRWEARSAAPESDGWTLRFDAAR